MELVPCFIKKTRQLLTWRMKTLWWLTMPKNYWYWVIFCAAVWRCNRGLVFLNNSVVTFTSAVNASWVLWVDGDWSHFSWLCLFSCCFIDFLSAPVRYWQNSLQLGVSLNIRPNSVTVTIHCLSYWRWDLSHCQVGQLGMPGALSFRDLSNVLCVSRLSDLQVTWSHQISCSRLRLHVVPLVYSSTLLTSLERRQTW